MQHIVNLLIKTVTYKIFQAIECLQNLSEKDDLQDAHLNFQNGGNASQLKQS